MIIIVGLGNPGEKFKNTRHNVGFMVVDFFHAYRQAGAKENDFPDFLLSKKYDALISESNHAHILENVSMENERTNEEIILVKPQTFMNESGKAVKKITTHYKLQTTNLIVIHDDIDLPLGKLKISKDSGAGGHKGIESIINNLGTKDFVRFKIGICPQKGKPNSVETFVVKKFTKEEQEILDSVIVKTSEALDLFIKEGLEKTMNKYNK